MVRVLAVAGLIERVLLGLPTDSDILYMYIILNPPPILPK